MKIIERRGYISIPEYNFDDSKQLQNYLSEFSEITFKRDYYGLSYDEETKELRVPAGIGVRKVASILSRDYTIDYGCDNYNSAEIELLVKPRDFIQEQIIKEATESKRSQYVIIANTGIGKTYCAIAIATIFEANTLIITHTSKLREHWSKKLIEYTDLEPEDIMIMNSSKKVLEVLESSNYKVYCTTHQILYNIAKLKGWDFINRMFESFGIGFTIIDEIHRQFRNTVRILTHTNTRKYLLLTATFKQSAKNQNRIFQTCFSTIPKFVQSELLEEKPQQHISGYVIKYNSHPDSKTQSDCEVKGLFNTVYYDNYLIDYDEMFYDIFDKYIDLCINGVQSYGGVGLVFCGSIYAAETLYSRIKEKYSGIGIYHSKIDKKEKEKTLSESKVIFTTSGSLGEGADIPNLHFIIDIEAYRSEILCEQIPGRLRNLNDGHKFNYFKITNVGFYKIMHQIRKCIEVWNNNFGSLKIRIWKNTNY